MVNAIAKKILLGAAVAVATAIMPASVWAGESYTCSFKLSSSERQSALQDVTESLRRLKGARANDGALFKFTLLQLASEVSLMELTRIGADVDFELEDDRRLTVDLVYSGPGIGDRFGVGSSAALRQLIEPGDDDCPGLRSCLTPAARALPELGHVLDLIKTGRAERITLAEVENLSRALKKILRRSSVGDQVIRIESSGERVVVGAHEDEWAHAKETLDVTGPFVVAGATEHGRLVVRDGRLAALGDLSGSCQRR